MKVMLSVNLVQIEINRILQASSSLHQKDAKPNLEVGAFVDIKILWWIHNRPIILDKIFVIKLISMDDQQMKSSHVAKSNEESHMATSEEKTYMESSY